MESPDERAAKLCRGVTFTPVSPDIIASFYEHTQRIVRVTDAGEVEFVSDGRKLTFANPGGAPVAPDTKLLGYFHPDDPRYLHLTTGKGAIVGTWVRRALVRAGDRESLEEAIRYQQAALMTAKEHAAKLASAEADRLTAMRLRNAALVSEHAPIEVTSPVASALKAAPRAVKAAKASRSEDERIAREALES
jgi:hypothetical protein